MTCFPTSSSTIAPPTHGHDYDRGVDDMTHEVCNHINANPIVQTKVLCQNGHCAAAEQCPTATLDRSVVPSVAVTDALIAPTNCKERSIDEDIAPPAELPSINANATLAKAHHSHCFPLRALVQRAFRWHMR